MLALVLFLAQTIGSVNINTGAALPASCSPPSVFLVTGSVAFAVCTATNVWTPMLTAPVAPSGLITLVTSGTCPAGYTELTALSGKTLIGTTAANGDVGATGGADTITPAGTNQALTFTGSSANTSAVTAGTPAGTNAASATTGNCAATNLAIGTGAATSCKATAPNLTVSAQTFTGSALGTHLHAVTATGTINTPTFTGTPADNRSAFIKVIFCQKQ